MVVTLTNPTNPLIRYYDHFNQYQSTKLLLIDPCQTTSNFHTLIGWCGSIGFVYEAIVYHFTTIHDNGICDNAICIVC